MSKQTSVPGHQAPAVTKFGFIDFSVSAVISAKIQSMPSLIPYQTPFSARELLPKGYC